MSSRFSKLTITTVSNGYMIEACAGDNPFLVPHTVVCTNRNRLGLMVQELIKKLPGEPDDYSKPMQQGV